ncbi:uncharacterized protein LOC113381760, partial [Ctenocephalides felis]|uniref:uncharacterized protein LOC113381760 n=1 Tax=Ctenocephalides felis TaxID=7515 RepID=UPI000E6E5710
MELHGTEEFFGDSVQAGFVMEHCSLIGLSQMNKVANSNGNYLDLFFTNCDLLVKKSFNLVPEDKYHPAIGTEIKYFDTIKPRVVKYFNFKKGDYGALNNLLLQANWISMYQMNNIDDIIAHFYSIIWDGIFTTVPQVSKKCSRYPCWFSKDLISKIKAKRDAHSTYKRTGYGTDYTAFSNLRNDCKKMSIQCYNDFTFRAEEKIKDNPQYFWKYIKMKKSSDRGIPTSMEWIDKKADGAENICNLFAAFFKSTYDRESKLLPNEFDALLNGLSNGNTNLSKIEISFDELLQGLLSLDSSMGFGPDGIPNLLLRECSVGLCEPLSFIFNKSLKWGVFPVVWKDAYAVPVFKSGVKSN